MKGGKMKKSVLILLILLVILTSCTNKNSDLSCSYTDSYDVTYKTNYTFKKGVVSTIEQIIKTPTSMVQNAELFRNDYENLNKNTDGCEGSYKEENGYYVATYTCDVNIISEEYAQKIFVKSKEDLKKLTRKEIVDFYKVEKPGENGKKTVCK